MTTPSALAIRRATRVRELNRMRLTELAEAFRVARRGKTPSRRPADYKKEDIINEILRLEGLEMTVLE